MCVCVCVCVAGRGGGTHLETADRWTSIKRVLGTGD